MPKGSRPTTNGQPKPKQVSNRILNKHPQLPQYPRSKGAGDVDVTFGVNISTPKANEMRGSNATQKPKVVTGSVKTPPANKCRRNSD